MQTPALLQFIRRLATVGESDLSDSELLRRFAHLHDADAFALLVGRHAALVHGVCWRVLQHEQDAEDAFQATFLVLAKKASAVRWRDSAGAWLYEVAHRLSLKARAAAVRRRAREGRLAGTQEAAPAAAEASWRETQAILERELRRMPEKYRAPVLLCCLEGATRDEAARQLGWSLRTVKRRLEEGRALLRERLARRGVSLAAALVGVTVGRGAAQAAPAPSLIQATARAAVSMALGQAGMSAISAQVFPLAKGMVRTMWWTQVKWTMAALIITALLGAGALAWTTSSMGPDGEQGPAVVAASLEAPAPAVAPLVPEDDQGFGEAVRAAAAVEDPARKARALLAIAEAQTDAGEKDAALRTMQEAFQAAGAIPEDRLDHFTDRCWVLSWIGQARAEAGDLEAAEKTTEAIRPLPGEEAAPPTPVQPRTRSTRAELIASAVTASRGMVYQAICMAQARAGKLPQAMKTLNRIETQFGSWKTEPLLAVVDALAKAGDWKEACEAAGRINGESHYEALGTIARRQAEAGHRDEARKVIEQARQAALALHLANGLPNDIDRDRALVKIALAQAEMGDLKEALQTAESCSGEELHDQTGRLVSLQAKEKCLVELKVRFGDFKAAVDVVKTIDEENEYGYSRGDALRLIARAQALAHDAKGALATADAIKHDFRKAAAFTDVGRALAKGGDRAAAAEVLKRALELARVVPEWRYPHLRSDPAQPPLLRDLAAAQEEAGERAVARAWIDKLPSPYLKAWARAGLAEGAAKPLDRK
jgi:RNA polymerase sigma factor (sigma-70 family)